MTTGFERRLRNLGLRFLDKTNVTVITLCTCFCLYTKSAAVAYFIAGATFCSLSAKVIKRCIRQPRPPPRVAGRKIKVSYGMPSTHSASIGYIATATVLSCMKLPLHASLRPELLWRMGPLLVVPPWSVTIMMSRVWLGHHTWPQVFAGAGYGIGMAWIWYIMWAGGLNTVGQNVEELALGWIESI